MKKRINHHKIKTIDDLKQYKEQESNDLKIYAKFATPIFIFQTLLTIIIAAFPQDGFLGLIRTFVREYCIFVWICLAFVSLIAQFQYLQAMNERVKEMWGHVPLVGWIYGLIFGLCTIFMLPLIPIFPHLLDLRERKLKIKRLEEQIIEEEECEAREKQIAAEEAQDRERLALTNDLLNELLSAHKEGRLHITPRDDEK